MFHTSRLKSSRLTILLIVALVVTALGTASVRAKTTVTYWTWNAAGFDTQPDGTPGPQKKAFDAANPDIDLQVKIYSYSDYLNQLQLNMASGSGPDLVAVQAGALLDTYKESAAGFMWYNKTIFDKLGLKPPTNWNEWIQTSKALNDKGMIGFFQGAGDSWINFDMYIALANELAPGKIYEAEAGKAKWTDPDLVKAIDYWKQMFSNGIMQKGALAAKQYPDAHQAFMTGKAGMMLMGVWNNYSALTKAGVADYQKSYGFTENYEYGTFLFPDISGDGKPGKPFGGPDVVIAVNKSSKAQDAAWKVMSWMMGEESQKLQAAILNVPAIKGIPFDDKDATGDFARQVLKEQIQQLNDASGKREFLYAEIKTALGDALQNVATGDQSPADAMAAVQAASDKIKR